MPKEDPHSIFGVRVFISFPSTVSLVCTTALSGRRGAATPFPITKGDVSTLISSHSPRLMKEFKVFAPPSTISDCTEVAYSSSSIFCGDVV